MAQTPRAGVPATTQNFGHARIELLQLLKRKHREIAGSIQLDGGSCQSPFGVAQSKTLF
jgi:hypothetical protein